jgi:putative tryptophan/tyrosine transport system substrate-binding protein
MDRSLGISRRRFMQGAGVAGLGLLAGCGRLPWQAQTATKVPRIGVLSVQPASSPWAVRYREAFLAGLRDLGYEEGRNLVIEFRDGEGQPERMPGLAADLARLPVDVLVLSGDASMAAARQATDTVPIVFALNSAPVETGVVASLARPGGNITGLSEITPELSGKRLELLRDTVPGLTRAGVLWSPQFPGPALQFQQAEAASQVLGIELLPLPVHSPADFQAAFQATTGHAEALLVLTGSVINPHATQVVELVARSSLPAIYGERLFVDAGGLMSYGANVADMWRRAATYVHKILQGTRPADLPVERPDRFDFIINHKTAQTLGLTIPHHVLLQATEVVQ